jgi:hypothetical protein
MSIPPSLRACVLMLSAVSWLSGCGVPEAEAPAEPSTPGEQSLQEQASEGGDAVHAQRACPENPAFQFVSRDPVQCLAITFECGQGQMQFFNECGCGCRGRPASPPGQG